MKKPETKKISLDIPVETLQRIDNLAKRGDITRVQLINNLLELGVGGLETCGRVGLLQTSLLIRDLSTTVKDWAKKAKRKSNLDEDWDNSIE